jgi:hypothetical protein
MPMVALVDDFVERLAKSAAPNRQLMTASASPHRLAGDQTYRTDSRTQIQRMRANRACQVIQIGCFVRMMPSPSAYK